MKCNQRGRVAGMAAFGLWLGVLTVQAGEPEAEAWYRDSYAPLWQENPYEKVDAMLSHYAPEVLTHMAEGGFRRDLREPWLQAPMAAWQAEGWVGSELIALQTTLINPNTATFLATWRDNYSSGLEEVTCGWYVAGRDNGAWRFTVYADTPCP